MPIKISQNESRTAKTNCKESQFFQRKTMAIKIQDTRNLEMFSTRWIIEFNCFTPLEIESLLSTLERSNLERSNKQEEKMLKL